MRPKRRDHSRHETDSESNSNRNSKKDHRGLAAVFTYRLHFIATQGQTRPIRAQHCLKSPGHLAMRRRHAQAESLSEGALRPWLGE